MPEVLGVQRLVPSHMHDNSHRNPLPPSLVLPFMRSPQSTKPLVRCVREHWTQEQHFAAAFGVRSLCTRVSPRLRHGAASCVGSAVLALPCVRADACGEHQCEVVDRMARITTRVQSNHEWRVRVRLRCAP